MEVQQTAMAGFPLAVSWLTLQKLYPYVFIRVLNDLICYHSLNHPTRDGNEAHWSVGLRNPMKPLLGVEFCCGLVIPECASPSVIKRSTHFLAGFLLLMHLRRIWLSVRAIF